VPEIKRYTPGWYATPRELETLVSAPYKPACQMLFDTGRPFWIRVLGARDVPRDWLRLALGGEQAGVFDAECGDLQVCREGATVRLDLRARDGDSVLWLPAAAVAGFLALTLALVPFGAEHVDWDELTRGTAA
jgi:Streptomyces sporulation and cell division protein, SsgA